MAGEISTVDVGQIHFLHRPVRQDVGASSERLRRGEGGGGREADPVSTVPR